MNNYSRKDVSFIYNKQLKDKSHYKKLQNIYSGNIVPNIVNDKGRSSVPVVRNNIILPKVNEYLNYQQDKNLKMQLDLIAKRKNIYSSYSNNIRSQSPIRDNKSITNQTLKQVSIENLRLKQRLKIVYLFYFSNSSVGSFNYSFNNYQIYNKKQKDRSLSPLFNSRTKCLPIRTFIKENLK